jgi:hypothetical protein
MKNSPETLRKRKEHRAHLKATIDPDSFPHQILRICKECHQERLCDWMGSFLQSGQPEYKARCVACHRTYLNSIRRKRSYKDARNVRWHKARVERKTLAVNRLGGKCKLCGYSKCIGSMTFHHFGDDKEANVTELYDAPLDVFLAEVDKCYALCFNCHTELHWNEGLGGLEAYVPPAP